MPRTTVKSVGRPERQDIEVARTSTWYAFVRRHSGLTETALEKEFTEPGMTAKRTSRPTRWNKYRFGRASPPRALLERVNERIPGSLAWYDHVVWTLAELVDPTAEDLRLLAVRLKPEFAALILDSKAARWHPFWQRLDFDHRSVITATQQWRGTTRHAHFDAVAALLWVAHDAVLRQNERQHFECYVAIAHGARAHYHSAVDLPAWRLEAHLFAKWLESDYRTPEYRQTLVILRSTPPGLPAPWIKVQPTLALSDASRLAKLQSDREERGYRAALRLPDLHRLDVLKHTAR